MGNAVTIGTSVINHCARKQLGIRIAEYAILDFAFKVYEDGIELNDTICMVRLGEPLPSVIIELNRMVAKYPNAIKLDGGIYKPGPAWEKVHKTSSDDVMLFKRQELLNGKKIRWRSGSSAKETEDKLLKLLRTIPFEVIYFAKLRYFWHISERDMEFIMNSARFVGPGLFYECAYEIRNEKGFSEYIRLNHPGLVRFLILEQELEDQIVDTQVPFSGKGFYE